MDKGIKVLEDVCLEIKSNNETIIDGPNILAVTDLGEYGIGISIVAKTNPGDQWSIERTIIKKVKEAFERENIEIPLSPILVGFAALLMITIVPKDVFKDQSIRIINIGSSQVLIRGKEVSRK